MKNRKIHLQLVLMFIVAFALAVIFTEGTRYFGKSYYESNSFDAEATEYMDQLARNVLAPLTEEDFEKVLAVTPDEITRYRLYYGSLAEQIQNIKDQYASDIDGAEDEDVLKALKQERDAKIADIQKNFDDDDYVKQKIVVIKQRAVAEILEDQQRGLRQFKSNNTYYAYDFYNAKKEEHFTKGEIDKAAVYEKELTPNELPNVTRYINLNEYEQVGYLDKTYTIEKDLSEVSGKITIPKSMLAKSGLGNDLKAFTIAKFVYYCIVLLGIVCLILAIKVVKVGRKSFLIENGLRNRLDRLPVDVQIALTAFVAYITSLFISSMTYLARSIAYYLADSYYIDLIENILLVLVTYGLFVAMVYFIAWTWERVKCYDSFEQLWAETFLAKFMKTGVSMFENRSVGMQSLILLIIIFLGGFGFAIPLVTGSFGAFMFYVFLFFVFFIPALFLFMRRMGYLNRIMKHTEDMAHGRLTENIKVKGKSPLARHAENLNGLREGVRTSLNEQAKSERLKTELITNVSHDLRTPLTSIITYTDLLKNPDLTVEERTKYIEILDAKSNRLKTLIEDLFEVSKMASGNIEISKQRIDLAQLLQQAAGEHEEDFAKSNLDLRVAISEQPIYAYVDGQKWWRVIDNLIVNARKYSLEGTRVYVNLKVNNGNAELTVKNVAKYELNEDATELIERFKRADTSRHTEGSGLGLAIAQSIVDLHGGQLDVSIDGDLFKVTVLVRAEN
ncbi:MAG: HAMP domain-containing sensor histidine kinase [Solibacillus sp.]|uniref:sensor histidine kinase n=1 Tax=unclassified Solibacillus TaxID=2637870 RepID=UPI003100D39C